VNWSTLKYIGQSPKHYLAALDSPREDTPAMLLGRVTHAMVLEPDTVAARYVVMPRFHGGMKDETAIEKGYDGGKQAKDAWLTAAGGAEVVPADVYTQATGMAEAVLTDPIAGPLFQGGLAEVRLEWTDVETGIQCRGRADFIGVALIDLKTTRNIEPRLFRRDIARMQMHAQLAYYYDGAVCQNVLPYIVSVENTAPFDVVVYQLTNDELAAGRAVCRKYLNTLSESRSTDCWPGVAGGEFVLSIDLPEWATPAPEITLGGVPLGM